MERRIKNRYKVWFPVQITSDALGALAVTHNVGAGGMLLASDATLEAGQRVQVTFSVPLTQNEYELEGHVLRVEDNPEDPDGNWPKRIALEFDQVQEELEPLFREAHDRISNMP